MGKDADDRLAILNLQALYARGADSFSGAEYAEAFTPDGVLDPSRTGIARVEGRPAIAALMDSVFARQTHNFHMVGNQCVTALDGDRAEGFCYFFQRSLLKNGGRTEFAGRYDDVYRRTAEGWKIERRVLVELLPTVLEGFGA